MATPMPRAMRYGASYGLFDVVDIAALSLSMPLVTRHFRLRD